MNRSILTLLLVILFRPAYSPGQAFDPQVSLLVKKSEYTLYVLKNDSVIRKYSIVVGKNSGDKTRRGDNRTPEGEFRIVQMQDSRHWSHDFGDGKGDIAGAYGPWFFRLGSGISKMKWRGIGIHGTHDPSSLGTMASEGCVRMRNKELEELRRWVTVGIPVRIIP